MLPCLRTLLITGMLFCLLLCGNDTRAQLCSGSLGDPVVNVTFGTTGSATPPLNLAGIKYAYTSTTCPNDGAYTFTSFTNNCFGNSWHSVDRDHTGDPGGRFMLVNASYDPSDFYVDTVSGLCAGTTYEFASWVVNVLRSSSGIRPNLTYRIETPAGTLLQEYNTGDIDATPGPQWRQFGFFFTTPPNEARIVLRITNNAPGGIGNDLGLDDITFRPCGPQVTATIDGQADTVNRCAGAPDRFTFSASVSAGYDVPVYQWQLSRDSGATWTDIPGASAPAYTRTSTPTGYYWYRLTVVDASNAQRTTCRIASNVVAVNLHPDPVVDAGPDRMVIRGRTTMLAGKAEGRGLAYAWSPPVYLDDAEALQPALRPETDQHYTLSAVSVFGCRASDLVEVKVVDALYVPNAFSPNGDGRNDTWTIPALDATLPADVRVFNRYGQLVYQGSGSHVSWDGRLKGQPQPTGVYVYYVRLRDDGLLFKGTLLLVR